MNVSLVARELGVGAIQLFNWRELDREGAIAAARTSESMLASDSSLNMKSPLRCRIDHFFSKEEFFRATNAAPWATKSLSVRVLPGKVRFLFKHCLL